MSTPLRLAIFASGNGSNFQNITQEILLKKLDAEVALCVTNHAEAGVLSKAKNYNIPTCVLDPTTFSDENEYTDALLAALNHAEANFIVLAGYLRKIPTAIIQAFPQRILNIHPSLLPAFGGKGMYGERVHQAVIEHGVRWTGVTVHLVDEKYDNGAIVLQEPVPVRSDDTVHTLAARVLKMEHRIFPEAIQLFAENKIRVEGRHVMIEGKLPRGRNR
jgi:phosphoribosylglycinamide formyltransferase-1